MDEAEARPYCAALSERFSCPIELFRGATRILVDERQPLEIGFADGTVTVTTPVAGAHDGLPPAIQRDLLRWNFPNNDLAGAMLRLRADQDYLELVNVLPLAAVAPDRFAAIAAKQAGAARMLSERIAAATRTFLATEAQGGR